MQNWKLESWIAKSSSTMSSAVAVITIKIQVDLVPTQQNLMTVREQVQAKIENVMPFKQCIYGSLYLATSQQDNNI